MYRYGRNGHIRSYIIREDEEFLKEHLKQLEKKQSKLFSTKLREDLTIYLS